MASIVLATINARYIHASLGLRLLHANLGELRHRAVIREFCLTDQPADMAEQILAQNPALVGIGVYIWNALEVRRLVRLIKRVAPELVIVLGGPEVSHAPLRVDFAEADYLIQGEGEHAFHRLCSAVLAGQPPPTGPIRAKPPRPETLESPYGLYTDKDLRHRLIYVEASRGCPFTCEFCLSSQDSEVRPFPLPAFLAELEQLWQRGARTFKFVDRTFNSNPRAAAQILDFFLERKPPYHVHFEVIPDHFPASLQERLQRFPAGSLQLEIGIQTLHPPTAATIRRRLHLDRIRDNLAFLDQHTTAHLHLDLIVGLPGESIEQFGANLDALVGLCRGEIQIGILKKLSGTTLNRHDREHGMVYAADPPYEILANDLIPFARMQEIKRLARFWDLVYNSGNFPRTAPLLWPDGRVFHGFSAFAAWLYGQTRATWQIALPRLAELLFNYLVTCRGMEPSQVADSLAADILVIKGRVLPPAILAHTTRLPETRRSLGAGLTRRQERSRAAAPNALPEKG
ncbi:MAG: DUF4080 domain-containing protein [Desulfobulbus sp.]|jgi:radical SAM superfamily enzyme YgiQ (UPF0313 family)